MEHPFLIAALGFKQTILAIAAALTGALAHALTEVRKDGWKGWVNFLSDTFVCVFFGFVFHQIGSVVSPEQTTVFTALGAFWGTESFKYLRNWVIKSLQANLPNK